MVFRNRYKTEPIYNLKYLINCIQYIHLNPVKAKMVKKCKDYPYSSYNQYIHNGRITKSKIMIDMFGDNYNYMEIFDNKIKYMVADIEEVSSTDIREYMDIAINDFMREYNIKFKELLSSKENLCTLIHVLKEYYHFKYIDIMDRFEINKSTLHRLLRTDF